MGRSILVRLTAVFLFVPLLSTTVFAQEVGVPDHRAPDVTYNPDEPVPYDPDEFPLWARDLRRGEIIAIGAFPIAMIITSIGYELGRFGYQSIRNGEPDVRYAPWFFSTNPEGAFNNGERIGLVLSSALLSTGVALIDLFLGKRASARH